MKLNGNERMTEWNLRKWKRMKIRQKKIKIRMKIKKEWKLGKRDWIIGKNGREWKLVKTEGMKRERE